MKFPPHPIPLFLGGEGRGSIFLLVFFFKPNIITEQVPRGEVARARTLVGIKSWRDQMLAKLRKIIREG